MAESSSSRTSGAPLAPTPRLSSAPSSVAAAAMGTSAIQVVVRLRPMNEYEKRHGTLPVVTAKTSEKSVTVIKGKGRKQHKSTYAFDEVFAAFSTQEEVFDATVKPVISDVLRGYEATVFAYGQTGTGKTHTMEGSLERPELYGVIPRSAQAIFEQLKQPRYREGSSVTCSCLEIYNEELRDLLADGVNCNGGAGSSSGQHNGKLDIMEGKNGTFCRGLTSKQVRSASDVLNLMQRAQHARMIGETKMNKFSSRSHCLFTVRVHGRIALIEGGDDIGDMEFRGKLHMVDLAGSECAKSAGNDKGAPDVVARERERMNINRSLLTLGRVITVLKDKSLGKNTNARIPYRDSKLTRILQEALGGRCKTVVVATISPSITAIEESVSTLNYAHSANGIVNKPVSSSLIALGEGIPPGVSAMMVCDSSDSRSPPFASVESWQEMEMRLGYMQAQVDEAQAALARKHLQQHELQERADRAQAELLDCRQQMHEAKREIKILKGHLETETRKRKETERDLHGTQVTLKKTEALLKATQATESSLTLEARALIGKLEEMIIDRNNMHALVVSQRNAECERRRATKLFQEVVCGLMNQIDSSLSNVSSSIETSQLTVLKVAKLSHEVGQSSVSETKKLITGISNNVTTGTDSIKAQLAGEGGMVSSVEARTNSILCEIQSINDEFVKGEELLEQNRQVIRRRIDECTKTLEECGSTLEVSTAQMLQSFEANVAEMKNAISCLVARMKSSMSSLSKDKAEKVKSLESLVEQWKDRSLSKSKSLIDVTTSTSMSLKTSINGFQKEIHNHEEIKKSLEEQVSFLDSTGSAHVQRIDEQGSLLNAHRQKLAESYDAQLKLRNEVMQSILSGVQSIVSSEIEKLATYQMKDFHLIDKEGADLSNLNERIIQSAKQVMENVKSTNMLVSGKASIVFENDAKTSEVMKSTHDTLKGVIMLSNAQHELSTKAACQSFSALSEMKQFDNRNYEELVKMAEGDEKAISTSLVNAVFQPMSVEAKKTLQSSLDAMAHVSEDVISYVKKNLEDISMDRQAVANRMSDLFESTRSQLSDMTGHATSIAKTQHDVAERLRRDTLAARNTHERESVPYYHEGLDSGRDKLISAMDNLAETSYQAISEGKARGLALKHSADDFANKKMQCTKPVGSVPGRKECSFSYDLSSTPAEDVIIKGIDFDASQPIHSMPSSASASRRKSESPTQADADTSHESLDDNDVLSRKSSGSLSSIPSPRLKSRDVNANHGNHTPSHLKSKKHHRIYSVGRKNKCPSGLATPSKQSRKRTKR